MAGRDATEADFDWGTGCQLAFKECIHQTYRAGATRLRVVAHRCVIKNIFSMQTKKQIMFSEPDSQAMRSMCSGAWGDTDSYLD